MKRFKIFPSLMMLAMGMCMLAVGVFCVAPISVNIIGELSILPQEIEVNSVNDYPTLEFYVTDSTAKTVSVQQNTSNKPTGDLIIPAMVSCNGVEYTVASIAYSTSGTKLVSNLESTAKNDLPIASIVEPGAGTDASGGFSSNAWLTSVMIPNTINNIGISAFKECSALKEAVMGNGVEIIGDSAFDGCTALEHVTIGSSVNTIEKLAFNGCTSLKQIVLPDSVQTIWGNAFYGCKYIEKLHIGSGLNCLEIYEGGSGNGKPSEILDILWGGGAHNNLISITVDEDNMLYNDGDGSNALIESATNKLLIGCNTTIMPNDILSIGSSAFYGCTDLTSIDLPDGLTSIESSAFYGCTGLTSIVLPDSLTSLGTDALSGTGITYTTYNNSYYLGSKSNMYFALVSATSTSITSCTINSSCKIVGDSAFSNCKSLTSITIPNNVVTIGNAAFIVCTKLNSLTIGVGVKSIENRAFYGCTGLTSVTIGTGVQSIGDAAFYNCTALTKLYCNAVVPPTLGGTKVFYNCAFTLYIPEESVDVYKNSDWGAYITES